MKFNDSLHEDLFDLFIMHAIWGKPEFSLEYPDFRSSRAQNNYENTKDLFPLENHPEEYVAWVNDYTLDEITFGTDESIQCSLAMVEMSNAVTGKPLNKIKITLEMSE